MNEAFLKDEEDGFKSCIMFISWQTNENFVKELKDKLIEKLKIMGEVYAVTWIKGVCIFLDTFMYFHVFHDCNGCRELVW